MKEKLKKYKHKTLGLEGELVKRNNQIVVHEDTISVLKAQVQVSTWGCSTGMGDVVAVVLVCFCESAMTLNLLFQACSRTPADVASEDARSALAVKQEKQTKVRHASSPT